MSHSIKQIQTTDSALFVKKVVLDKAEPYLKRRFNNLGTSRVSYTSELLEVISLNKRLHILFMTFFSKST